MTKKISLKYVIVFVVLWGAVTGLPSLWKIHQQHKAIVDLRAKNVAQWEKWKNDSTKIVVQAEENKELNNLYISQIKTTAKWRRLAEELQVEEVDSGVFSMDTLTECYYAEASMNILTRKGTLEITPNSVILNIELAYIDKGLSVGRAWTDSGCLEFEDTKLEIPDNLDLDCYRENKWPWVVGALGVGVIIGCIIE